MARGSAPGAFGRGNGGFVEGLREDSSPVNMALREARGRLRRWANHSLARPQGGKRRRLSGGVENLALDVLDAYFGQVDGDMGRAAEAMLNENILGWLRQTFAR